MRLASLAAASVDLTTTNVADTSRGRKVAGHDSFGKQNKDDMTQNPRQTIARILKVNHAGEYGAIRIYRAQLWFAQRFYPDLIPFLQEMLGHEIQHCSTFQHAMTERSARPCRIMSLWGQGGFILGACTAMMGRHGIWICTEAVESTVHSHLQDQLHYLRERDPDLHNIISKIQREELRHLTRAQHHITTRHLWTRLLTRFVTMATETVIWLSTWGDSRRMKRELANARRA